MKKLKSCKATVKDEVTGEWWQVRVRIDAEIV